MKLKINNIGKIKKIDIDIDKITVIAGQNDTGKSTIAKAFYTIFNSFSNFKSQIQIERKNSIIKFFVISNNLFQNLNRFVSDLLEEFNQEIELDEFARLIENIYNRYNKNKFPFNDVDIKKMYNMLKVTDKDILTKIITRRINSEFDHQISNFYDNEKSEISLLIHNVDEYSLFIENNILTFKNEEELSKKAIYIDDPFILDSANEKKIYGSNFSNNYYHRNDVVNSLLKEKTRDVIDEILVDEHFKNIENILNKIEVGSLTYSNNITYKKVGMEKDIDLANVSAGLKTFIIIKTLLYNESINEKGTLILDEPEIHLHPEWQLLFAKLIVLLQKEFDLHILITTHSPYFLEALQVYSKKYKVETKFYLLEHINKISSNLKDVSENIDEIYKQMARPFIQLEELDDED